MSNRPISANTPGANSVPTDAGGQAAAPPAQEPTPKGWTAADEFANGGGDPRHKTARSQPLYEKPIPGLLRGLPKPTLGKNQASGIWHRRPTSLKTERLHDGDANCLERATLWARDGQDVLFMRDHANLDRDNAGHVLIRDSGTGKIWDPQDGRPPADATQWKYSSVEDWRLKRTSVPGQHGQYTVDAAVPAAAVLRVLSAEPGANRDAELEAIKQENPEVGDKLEAVANLRYARIYPEDVASEMVNLPFELTRPFGRLRAGDRTTVVAWDNSSDTVTVRGGGPASPTLSVPKTALKPGRPTSSTLAPYSTGIEAQATAVEKTQRSLTSWLAKENQHKTSAAKDLFRRERARLEALLVRQREVLNRKLIQEAMYNRFDPAIQGAVDDYNRSHGLEGDDALDPNLVKSMLFQESQLGTAGQHLEDPPSHPVRSRFNLGQVIDSSGLALMAKLERDHPSLMRRELPSMRADLEAAKQERDTLRRKRTLTEDERRRLEQLDRDAGRNWEIYIWNYRPAPDKTFAGVIRDYFGQTNPPRNESYDFWIDMTVLWLGAKHRSGQSWSETIRRYNGGGPEAARYRDQVVARAARAEAAHRRSVPFQPRGI